MDEEESGPRQRAAETKRRRTRESIVNGTIDLFKDQEHGDYTLGQIAEEAGVGTATIVNNFGTKYEVLRTAHDRLLAPIIEPITAGAENGTYKPKDGVDELIRYIYAIAKMCQQHQALTVAMIRAYFEQTSDGTLDLGSFITKGLHPILMAPPFIPGEGVDAAIHIFSQAGTRRGAFNHRYHTWALMMTLYHGTANDEPSRVAEFACSQMLAAALPEVDPRDLSARLPRIKEKVDGWFERREDQEI
ncbi:TetR/AcrR family transcriptional regulator [Streptomyces sp. HM190]|uniref:TetR/AcrR family transcriptional regulator n=1 Tax=Streptomyces sp. HM190 TaxID=2695266 RepID=UPI0013593972|nr:TetR/AcrR family transcriptional regulator [Streptomyces sp. HM190]